MRLILTQMGSYTTTMKDLVRFKSPLKGILHNLERVPDPVFSGKMMGEGFAIDPLSSQILAPFCGKVTHIHPYHHAMTITSDEGLEVLLHTGVDTVKLKGKGFQVPVQQGQLFREGDLLQSFDLDILSDEAPCAWLIIVFPGADKKWNMDVEPLLGRANEDLNHTVPQGVSVEYGQVLSLFESLTQNISLSSVQEDFNSRNNAVIEDHFLPIVKYSIKSSTGLHARPAARLAQLAKVFQGILKIKKEPKNDSLLDKGPTKRKDQIEQDWLSPESLITIMAMEISCGDSVLITALTEAPQASEAITKFFELLKTIDEEEQLKSLSSETCSALTISTSATSATSATSTSSATFPPFHLKTQKMGHLSDSYRTGLGTLDDLYGIIASPGLAVGPLVFLREDLDFLHTPIEFPKFQDLETEKRRLSKALESAQSELKDLKKKLESQKQTASQAEIFSAHQEMLNDPDLMKSVLEGISQKKPAAEAWRDAVKTNFELLAHLKNELLAARSNDLKDVGERVFKHLLGTIKSEAPDSSSVALKSIVSKGSLPFEKIERKGIYVAHSLTPSQVANLGDSPIMGLCTVTGGASSHVAILARALGIPALTGVPDALLTVEEGTLLFLDAERGMVHLNPSQEIQHKISKKQEEQQIQKQKEMSQRFEEARTKDQHSIEVATNISGLSDAKKAMELGSDAIGLLRSEFLYLHRDTAPTEEEQWKIYNQISKIVTTQKKFIVRTLDIGGDKPLSYLPIEKEENPFLGERGIRVSLRNESIFRQQIKALLKVEELSHLGIMFPMVTHLHEWRKARDLVIQEAHLLGVQVPSLGIMIEVPAAALMSEVFAPEVDFFSIGTNDLTQYTLAVDRGHRTLSTLAEALHPSVLMLIKKTVEAAHRYKKWVGLCGGLASDQDAVPLLVGLGLDELSVSVPAVGSIKSKIRKLNFMECKKLADQALQMQQAEDVKNLINDFNKQIGKEII